MTLNQEAWTNKVSADLAARNANWTALDLVIGKVYDTNGAAYVSVWIGTQAAYDLLTPDANTLYLIEEA